MSFKTALIATITLVPTLVMAQSKNTDSILKAQSSMSAFSCSALAAIFDDKLEAKRLFNVGYKEGKGFLKLLLENQFSQEELYSKAPSGFLSSASGPNDEFMIGRVYESTISYTLEKFYERVGSLNEEGKKNAAKIEFKKTNCALIKDEQ